MIPAKTPENENLRIASLHNLQILDTPAEERFDRLTRLASHLLNVPITLISLVDDERQWFKSRQGLDACETDRRSSFCSHAILTSQPLIINDTARDIRFADNPLVTGSPHIRAYAGIPLELPGGHRVGTLCSIDTAPRNFSTEEIQQLQDLAAIAVEELAKVDLNRAVKELQKKTTELVEHEAQLIRARKQAEAANRAKSNYLAFISHEIRNPLNAVIGFLSELKTSKLRDQDLESVELASECAELLLTLINDLLDFSKIEAGKLTLEKIPTNITECLRDVHSIFAKHAKAKKLQLNLVIDPAAEVWVSADPTRIKQILVNLVSNAIKFTPEGSVSIEIRVLPCKNPQKIRLKFSVKDTGIGIPPDKLNHLFKPYDQLDNSISRTFGGTGLGLSICKRLIQAMGSEIEVKTEVHVGTHFYFSLSLDRISADVNDSPAASDSFRAALSSPPANLRILVVEDNPVNSRLLDIMLKRLGQKADLAGNGPDAIQLVQQSSPYDFILMDYEMPGMNGIETTKAIRRIPNGSAPKIIAVTGHTGDEEKSKCSAAGMDQFLSKPIRIEALQQSLFL